MRARSSPLPAQELFRFDRRATVLDCRVGRRARRRQALRLLSDGCALASAIMSQRLKERMHLETWSPKISRRYRAFHGETPYRAANQ